jgi:hypothetical protein
MHAQSHMVGDAELADKLAFLLWQFGITGGRN